MKIAILSRNPKLYSTCRLKEAALAQGHEVKVIDILKCYMNINSSQLSIHYKGKKIPHYDAIIPRIGAKNTFYGASVVRQFEAMGTFSINTSISITRSRDKLRSLQLLSRKGIGMPITGVVYSTNEIEDLIAMVGGTPIVIKVVEGTQGVGVVLAESQQSAESVIESFFAVRANVIIQEYIEESGGADIRCLVIGNKVVATMKRYAPPGDFRSNIHRGGHAEVIKISKAERDTALNAVKGLGLHFAGVDLLQSNRGPLVMEVNSSPGLQGIEQVTGIDLAKLVIEYLEKYAKPITSRTHYQG